MCLTRYSAAVAILFALPLSAQQLPDAEGLLDRAMYVLKGQQSIEFTRDIAWQGEAALPGAINTVAVFQAKNGKFRIDLRNNALPFQYLMDGQYTWAYMPATSEYTKHDGPEIDIVRRVISGTAGPGIPAAFAGLPGANTLRSEVVEVDGQERDCWVTESHATTRRLPSGREISDEIETAWYDKALGLMLIRNISAELRTSAADLFSPVRMRITTHGLKLNSALDESLFVFTPPAGAREASSNVRPPLIPIKKVRPGYPTAAKAARAEGTVKFVATIGKDGSVRELKVISGHPLLIEAAMDAAKQWTYNPTLLNGSPVEVLTTISIDFALGPPRATK